MADVFFFKHCARVCCGADSRDADQLFEQVLPYLERCLALRKKHVLTLAVLKLCQALISMGLWDEDRVARLVPHLVAIMSEEDSFTAAQDDDWAEGYRRLLRAKLLASSILHLILSHACHDTTIRMLQAALADDEDAAANVGGAGNGSPGVRSQDTPFPRRPSQSISRSTTSRQASSVLLRRGLSSYSAALLDGCGPRLTGVVKLELPVWHAMHSLFELGEPDGACSCSCLCLSVCVCFAHFISWFTYVTPPLWCSDWLGCPPQACVAAGRDDEFVAGQRLFPVAAVAVVFVGSPAQRPRGGVRQRRQRVSAAQPAGRQVCPASTRRPASCARGVTAGAHRRARGRAVVAAP